MNNIKLNKEQQNAIEKIQNGGNYIILGKAGTGKTTLLHHLRQALPDAVFVAPTGNAARQIGGTTINSLFLIPSYPFISSWTLGVISSKKARKIISKIKTLVIDEISMVRSDIFAAIDCRLRQYGPPGAECRPFGGRQIILCGDFFQLPPVVTNDDVGGISVGEALEQDLGGIYPFDTPLWTQTGLEPIYLRTNIRQSDDEKFKTCLDAFRCADQKRRLEAINLLNSRVSENIPAEAIYLCPRKNEVNIINEREIAKLKTEERVFRATIHGCYEKDFPVETEIKLKLGQKIVIHANISENVVNGTAGTVSAFHSDGILVRLDDGGEVQIEPYEFKKYAYRLVRDPVTGEERPVPFEIGRFRQLPVLSGYALTIHKAQGMTLKSVALNRGKGCFSHGQCYVGISRVRRLDDLFLSAPLEIADVIVDPDVLQADRVFRDDPNLWRACVIHKLKELKHDERDYAGHLADWGTAILNEIAADYNTRFDTGEEPTNNEVDQKLAYLCRQLFLHHTGQARCSLNAVFKDLLKCLDM